MVYSTLVTLRRKGYQGRSPWLVRVGICANGFDASQTSTSGAGVCMRATSISNVAAAPKDLRTSTALSKLGPILIGAETRKKI
jgi:hypothetical protein